MNNKEFNGKYILNKTVLVKSKLIIKKKLKKWWILINKNKRLSNKYRFQSEIKLKK